MKVTEAIKQGVEFVGRVKKDRLGKRSGSNSINQRFYDDVINHFEGRIESASVGKRMLFDMGYIIWMHPDDYKKIRQQLIAIIPEIIDEFYEIINKRLDRYPKCLPSSKDWFFQVTPTDVIKDGDTGLEELKEVEQGKFIISSFYFSMSRLKSNAKQQSDVTLSFCPQNSDTMKDVNINSNLLVGIEVEGDSYSIDFDPKRVKCPIDMTATLIEHGYGELSYSRQGVIHRYTMVSKRVYVSGAEDNRADKIILSVPCAGVKTNHLEFRYDEVKNCFEVAAWGKTRMNEALLELSEQGNPKWYAVPKKSNFILGDGMEVFSLMFEQSGFNE